MKKVVVIIGAGPAGLTAAHTLLSNSKEYEVVILEESREVGGISRTVRYHGNRMDIGGHRFFSKNQKVMDWWKDMMPLQGAPAYDDQVLGRTKPLAAEGPDPEQEDRVMLIRERVSRIYYLKHFFDYPISVKWQTFTNMGLLQTIKVGFSYLKSMVHKLPENSLENFYINRFGRVLYSMFFEGYTEKLWGRHPREISADWGAQRVKGLSVVAIIKDVFARMFSGKESKEVETSLIEEFWYPKFGPGQLWETVAGEIEKMGGKIIYHASVDTLHTEEGKVSEVGYRDTKAGEQILLQSDFCISSMSLKDLTACMEEVPTNVQRIASGLPYRDFVTVGLLLKKLNLKNLTKIKTLNNIVPDCWIYVQDTNVKLGRIQIFNNWSPYMVSDIQSKVWIGLEYFCDEDDTFWNMEESECAEFAMNELIKMDIIESKDDVEDYHREKVKKAYPAYFDTYSEVEQLIDYLNTFDNLYCVGRNGQHRYNNMDHSMVTAFEAANNILQGIQGKDNVWNVNTDKIYHEIKGGI